MVTEVKGFTNPGQPLYCSKLCHLFLQVTRPLDEIAEWILACEGIEGVTFSGGEPMQQADSLRRLIGRLRHHTPELSLGMFSGYTERELDAGRYSIWDRQIALREKQDLWQRVRKQLDFAVLGRFNYLHRGEAPLRSSRNQVSRLFSERYTESNFGEQLLEINIHGDGRTDVTGFPVLGLPW